LGRDDEYIQKYMPLAGILQHINGLENQAQTTKESLISNIISARKRGNISRNTARNYLLSLGLSQVQTDLSIANADLQYTVSLKQKAQDIIQKQYAIHNIDDNEFYAQLKEYDFSVEEIKRALQEANLMRLDKQKKLTEKQIEALFKDGIIDETQYRNKLAGLGYIANDVDLLVKQDIIGLGA
jgi:hypothetical protein